MGPVRIVKVESFYRITCSWRYFWIRDGCCSAYIFKIKMKDVLNKKYKKKTCVLKLHINELILIPLAIRVMYVWGMECQCFSQN